MGQYTVTTTPEQDRVLALDVLEKYPLLSVQELIQLRIDNYLSERAGHFGDPREVLNRLGPAERDRIPADIRVRLGIEKAT